MLLKLTIVSYQGRPCEPEARHIEGGRLTIGRANDRDWILNDPELSRFHCCIERVGDGYVIIEDARCSNGVYLNGGTQRLGPNNNTRLADRDEFAIGPYRVRVELAAAGSPPFCVEPVLPDMPWLPIANPAPGPFAPQFPEGPQSWPGQAGPFVPQEQHLPWRTDGQPQDVAPLPGLPAQAPSLLHSDALGSGQASVLNAAFVPPPIAAPAIPPGWNPLAEREAPHPVPIATPALPVPVPPPATAPSAPAMPSAPVSAREAMRAFLAGAGFDEEMPPGDDLARLQQFGEMFRELAVGLRDLVNARAEIKSSFHLPPTVIAASDNNPFKFSVDSGQLLSALLTSRRPGYAKPLPAILEAIMNLKEHDLGLLRAMQEAVDDLLAKLSPQTLQRTAEDAGMLGQLLHATRKAAWWDAFEAAHRQAVEGVEVDIPGGFRQIFAEAYARRATPR